MIVLYIGLWLFIGYTFRYFLAKQMKLKTYEVPSFIGIFAPLSVIFYFMRIFNETL